MCIAITFTYKVCINKTVNKVVLKYDVVKTRGHLVSAYGLALRPAVSD